MKRVFGPYVYSDVPRANCWWSQTCDIAEAARLDADISCDVAVVGGGFTGLNAALKLSEAGADVALFEAREIGWGASSRNGGFCCLGGSMVPDATLDKHFGKDARLEWRGAEVAAVRHVEALLDGVDADVTSSGETWLAHRPKHMRNIVDDARQAEENYGCTPEIHSPDDLERRGLNAGFHGGMTLPIGFGLNPRKYVKALQDRATASGARLFEQAQVNRIERSGSQWRLQIGPHHIRADNVLIATNGYSSDDLPPWLRARYMPVQSSVAVTRPLTDAELERQGWTSEQMCYDSRNLLHYFRLLPDRRMLFGMRGGLGSSARSDARAQARLARDFASMFPAWNDVPLTHSWSGMVSLSATMLPLVGEVPGQAGLFHALCYHGNGVAMGSYCGAMAATMMAEPEAQTLPAALKGAPKTFPLGPIRRALMWPAYAAMTLADR